MPEFHEHILTFHFEGVHQLQTKALFKWIGMKQITVKTLRMSQLNQNNDNRILSFSSIGQKIIIVLISRNWQGRAANNSYFDYYYTIVL